MNRATIERLNRINLDFYRDRAGEFDQARDLPWQGWKRVVDATAAGAARRQLSVLDAGCGNGRFASYLNECVGGFDYLGVDSSRRLLEIARQRLSRLKGVHAEWLEIDLAADASVPELAERRFDLVVAFGLLHHVPSLALRTGLLARLVAATAPGGLLAVAFWQFAEHRRFQRRFVDWETFNRATKDPVQLDQLENGDHLLAWGDDRQAVRYCHWSDPEEIHELVASSGIQSFELYSGRGGDRFNLYALIRP